MNENEIVASIMEQTGQDPQVTPSTELPPQEQPQVTPSTELPPQEQPQVTPPMTQEEYQAILAQALAPLEAKINEQPSQVSLEQPLSEEDIALEELRKRLGLDKLQQENEELKSKVKQQEEMEAQRAFIAQQQKIQQDITAFKHGKADNAEEMVLKKLNELQLKDPNLAVQFDNPYGWDLIYQAEMAKAQPIATPDPIIPQQDTVAPAKVSAFDRAKAGEKVTPIEFGMELLEMSRGQ